MVWNSTKCDKTKELISFETNLNEEQTFSQNCDEEDSICKSELGLKCINKTCQ